jgi:hypothetical protein
MDMVGCTADRKRFEMQVVGNSKKISPELFLTILWDRIPAAPGRENVMHKISM